MTKEERLETESAILSRLAGLGSTYDLSLCWALKDAGFPYVVAVLLPLLDEHKLVKLGRHNHLSLTRRAK